MSYAPFQNLFLAGPLTGPSITLTISKLTATIDINNFFQGTSTLDTFIQ